MAQLTHKQRMKLGRKAAYLRKCIRAMELVQKFESSTSVRRRVFEEHIYPVLLCSYPTFNNMLNEVNPQAQLEEIEKQLIKEK